MAPAGLPDIYTEKGNVMLGWALAFFILAIVAALFGFGGIAAASAGIAQILFILFLVLLAVSLIAHVMRGRGTAARH